MAWDFETDPEYQAKLDWADAFVREEVEPLDLVWEHEQFVPLDAPGARRSTRSSRRCAGRDCGRRISAPSSAARDTDN